MIKFFPRKLSVIHHFIISHNPFRYVVWKQGVYPEPVKLCFLNEPLCDHNVFQELEPCIQEAGSELLQLLNKDDVEIEGLLNCIKVDEVSVT